MDKESIETEYQNIEITEDIKEANRIFDSWNIDSEQNEEIYEIISWDVEEEEIVIRELGKQENTTIEFDFEEPYNFQSRWYLVKVNSLNNKE